MKMMKKVLFSLFLFSVIFVCNSLRGYAKTDDSTMLEELKLLEEKYDVEFSHLDQNDNLNLRNSENLLNFSSVKELEQFLIKLNEQEEHFDYEISISDIKNTRIADAHTITWYSNKKLFDVEGAFAWNNVSFSYDYKFVNGRPQFNSVSNIKSYISGLSMASWQETNAILQFYSAKYSTKDTANFKVTGYYLLGVSINGFPVGLTQNDTWTCSLTLVP